MVNQYYGLFIVCGILLFLATLLFMIGPSSSKSKSKTKPKEEYDQEINASGEPANG